MIVIPEKPAQDDEPIGTAELYPRYEDIAQDGRLFLTAMMPGLGASVWRMLGRRFEGALEAFRVQGVLPILRRLILVGEPGPLSVYAPLRFSGSFRLAREKNGDRLFLNMWMEARAPVATTFGPLPSRDAPALLVGRLFAEHVMTRPFAPPAERKVTRIDAPGFPAVPDDVYVFEPAEALVSQGALEDAGEVLFGMMHTDSNQHVNSLVYPRVFEEALVRRRPNASLLARAVEIRFRKPFFAGDRAALWVGGRNDAEVVGAFVPPDGAPEKPSCAIRMTRG